jgi:hypothetical protein
MESRSHGIYCFSVEVISLGSLFDSNCLKSVPKTEQYYSLPGNCIPKTEQYYSLPGNSFPKTEQYPFAWSQVESDGVTETAVSPLE